MTDSTRKSSESHRASGSGSSLEPTLDRRRFLRYVGAGAATLFARDLFGPADLGALPSGSEPPIPARETSPWVGADGLPSWVAPAYPVPLPGDPQPVAHDRRRLARYAVTDDLVVPEGFRYHVIARYGDPIGPQAAGDTGSGATRGLRFGYNNDYTGLLPIPGTDDQYWLFVNHEYVSGRPWLDTYTDRFGEAPPVFRLEADAHDPPRFSRGVLSIDGWRFDGFDGHAVDVRNEEDWARVPARVKQAARTVAERILDDVGVSVLRVRRQADGSFDLVADATDHRRITAFRRYNVPGPAARHSTFTGPAAPLFDRPPHGTMCNCSGGTTPWGTFLTCEENFYNEVDEDVTPEGCLVPDRRSRYGAWGDKINGRYVFDNPTPPNIMGNGHVLAEPLDGRHFGWVTEVDPATGHLRKHTALGRFRHENAALRVEEGKPLAVYMGDDRRGGHVWKYVSRGTVGAPSDPANARLLEDGTLYVARFEEDFTGRWIPLDVATPLRRPEPDQCFSGHVQVPSRFVGGSVSVGDPERDRPDMEVAHWVSIVESFAEKPFDQCTLGDLVRPEGYEEEGERAAVERRRRANGILAMDAFLMANACGGTPTARPEDLEVHPIDRTVYIAFTDATDSSDGSPDQRIFPDSSMENSRQYGAIYRLIEGGEEGADGNPAATTFTWGKFVSSGEVAAQGGGFACADNMAFDPACNLWMMTDISTSVQNFPTTRLVTDGTNPGGKSFRGVFGNNALFMIPTHGPRAGIPHLFGLAPMDAELCGPTFTADGRTLILSVQHPGEFDGTRVADRPDEVQTHIVHDRADQPFEQQRTVPVGSNFPGDRLGTPPRPAVVCITLDPSDPPMPESESESSEA